MLQNVVGLSGPTRTKTLRRIAAHIEYSPAQTSPPSRFPEFKQPLTAHLAHLELPSISKHDGTLLPSSRMPPPHTKWRRTSSVQRCGRSSPQRRRQGRRHNQQPRAPRKRPSIPISRGRPTCRPLGLYAPSMTAGKRHGPDFFLYPPPIPTPTSAAKQELGTISFPVSMRYHS